MFPNLQNIWVQYYTWGLFKPIRGTITMVKEEIHSPLDQEEGEFFFYHLNK